MVKLAVIGGGAWGTALACVARRCGHETMIACRTKAQAEEINQLATNHRYLAGLQLEPGLTATEDMADAIEGSGIILLAVPAQKLAGLVSEIGSFPAEAVLVTTCKGIDQSTGLLPAETVENHFPDVAVAALSGPSFAHDVVRGLPTAVTIASKTLEVSDRVAGTISNEQFRCYSSNDLRGVELGGALKNVLALAVGAARGMALGASAEAALIARGFAEITRLATALGARPETLMGLSGLGDITLTCSTPQSRNFSYGMALGKGESLEGLKLAEGAFTASIALKLAREHNVDVPITEAVVQVLEKQVTAREAVHQLLTRPLKREN